MIADKHAHPQTDTDTFITILRSCIGGRVTRTNSCSRPTDNKRPHRCCHLQWAKNRNVFESQYTYITLQQLEVERHVMCKKISKFYVEKKYETYMSIKLNFVCLVCINLDECCIWQHMNFTQFFTQTDSKSNVSITRKSNTINNTVPQSIRIHHEHPSPW